MQCVKCIVYLGHEFRIEMFCNSESDQNQSHIIKNINSNIHFTYQKSVIMATYMLCGFANFASIGCMCSLQTASIKESRVE